MADARHRQVVDRRPYAFRAQHLAGVDGAAEPLVVRQPIGRREVDRAELRLVAAHAKADHVAVRLAAPWPHHGERPIGAAMADAEEDDAAFDADVAPARSMPSSSASSQAPYGIPSAAGRSGEQNIST